MALLSHSLFATLESYVFGWISWARYRCLTAVPVCRRTLAGIHLLRVVVLPTLRQCVALPGLVAR